MSYVLFLYIVKEGDFDGCFFLVVKSDIAVFEANMSNHSQDITKKEFQQ